MKQAKALHYGYWKSDTTRLTTALELMNSELAAWAEVPHQARILDAGCGVGGSALFLAKHYKAQVHGITLGTSQIAEAQKYAAAENLSDQCTFSIADYTKSALPEASFDVIWALESLFHQADKRPFLREAHRLLKPKGKLIWADYVQTEWPTPPPATYPKWLKQWKKGYAFEELYTLQDWERALADTHFLPPKLKNVSAEVLPSARRLARWGRAGMCAHRLTLGLLPKLFPMSDVAQTQATIAQYQLLQAGGWQYYWAVTEKADTLI